MTLAIGAVTPRKNPRYFSVLYVCRTQSVKLSYLYVCIRVLTESNGNLGRSVKLGLVRGRELSQQEMSTGHCSRMQQPLCDSASPISSAGIRASIARQPLCHPSEHHPAAQASQPSFQAYRVTARETKSPQRGLDAKQVQ